LGTYRPNVVRKVDVKELFTKFPNCWEVINCSYDVRSKCPAQPDMGRECWKVTGTLCKCSSRKGDNKSLAEKIVICRNECAYYQSYIKMIYH
jgi:hypothetical protein